MKLLAERDSLSASMSVAPSATRAAEKTQKVHAGTLRLAVLFALPVIAFEQFLHTTPAAQAGSPGYETLYWLSDALFALPLAAVAVWGGRRIADRWGFGWSAWSMFARAGLTALAFGILLIPGWFLHDSLDSLAHTAAAASGHSGHGGHSHS
ncbi:MAG: hypothetical protein J2P17_18050, partial [Mycobacterium sp.]|nr:hypothetical protein [Mycobacterium sp.]